RIDPSEYGFSWHVYNSNYSHYMMFGVQNDRITAFFSKENTSWGNKNGIKIGQTITEAKKLVSQAANAESNDNYYAYTTGNERTILFIDRQAGNKISGKMRM